MRQNHTVRFGSYIDELRPNGQVLVEMTVKDSNTCIVVLALSYSPQRPAQRGVFYAAGMRRLKRWRLEHLRGRSNHLIGTSAWHSTAAVPLWCR